MPIFSVSEDTIVFVGQAKGAEKWKVGGKKAEISPTTTRQKGMTPLGKMGTPCRSLLDEINSYILCLSR
jgi:hypothetical protein